MLYTPAPIKIKVKCQSHVFDFGNFWFSSMSYFWDLSHQTNHIKFIIMDTRMMYIPSGEVYNNRKEAKLMMGHANFNRALRYRLMLIIDGSDLFEHNNY